MNQNSTSQQLASAHWGICGVKVRSDVALLVPDIWVTPRRNKAQWAGSVGFSTRGEDSSGLPAASGAAAGFFNNSLQSLSCEHFQFYTVISQAWKKSPHPLTERSATDCVLNMYQGHLQVRLLCLCVVSCGAAELMSWNRHTSKCSLVHFKDIFDTPVMR